MNSFLANRFVAFLLESFVNADDERRIRELAKVMASENDPAKLKDFVEELKIILARNSAMKPPAASVIH